MMIEAKGSVVVHAPVELCFEDWRQMNRLPHWMSCVDAITSTGKSDLWHWQVVHPSGYPIEWDTQITVLVPNTQLSWRPVKLPFQQPFGITGNIQFIMLDSYTSQIRMKLRFDTNQALTTCWSHILINPDKAANISLSKFKNRAELRTLRPLIELMR